MIERLQTSSPHLSVCKLLKIALTWLLFSISGHAQVNKEATQQMLIESLEWLVLAQEKQTIKDSIFKGEWSSTMGLKNRFLYLGKAFPFRDSNCFTQANIFNALSEIYLANKSLKQILPMLELAKSELLSYREGTDFNFWKALSPNIPLSRRGPWPEAYLAHRPTNFKLKTRFINNAADIANDADDTATGNLALHYYGEIFGEKVQIPTQNIFDSNLDGNRKNYHWYNFIHNIPRPSRAYMTWLAPEYQFKHWNFPWQVAHNLVFFLPGSSCFPRSYTRYVPWGANDVDAVVNCNVLNYLGKTGQLEGSFGKNGALNLLRHVIKKERWSRAGLYYPNRFFIHLSISKVFPYFEEELEPEIIAIKKHLLRSQKPDGSFESRRKVNKKDLVQSTIYATLAMLNLKEAGEDIPMVNIQKSIEFIISQRNEENFWKGGVFFSGGTVVRNVLYFKSEAYTTALAAQCLQKYLLLN
jgi:hypothetical protein